MDKVSEAESQDWLNYVASQRWLTQAPLRIVSGGRQPDGCWRIGEIVADEDALVRARPAGPPSQILGFDLIHGGWRVARFRLFRPVVYFAAFSAHEIFECLELAVESLLVFGNWQHDVVVLTAPQTVDLARSCLLRFGLGTRLHVAEVAACADVLDWCLARYRLNADPCLRNAQPLLYPDVDVVCDQPLEPLLAALVYSPVIHACREGRIGEGHPDSAGHWFGWRLMQADGVPFDPNAHGFSTGVLGAANVSTAGDAYDLILRCAYGFAASIGDRHRFQGYDQAYANYTLMKLGTVEINMIASVLNLFRVPAQGPVHPDPTAARGLVHFLGVPTAQKREAMRAYMSVLKRRQP